MTIPSPTLMSKTQSLGSAVLITSLAFFSFGSRAHAAIENTNATPTMNGSTNTITSTAAGQAGSTFSNQTQTTMINNGQSSVVNPQPANSNIQPGLGGTLPQQQNLNPSVNYNSGTGPGTTATSKPAESPTPNMNVNMQQ